MTATGSGLTAEGLVIAAGYLVMTAGYLVIAGPVQPTRLRRADWLAPER